MHIPKEEKKDASLLKDSRIDVFPTPPSPMKTIFIFEDAIFFVPEISAASKNDSMSLLSSSPTKRFSKGFPLDEFVSRKTKKILISQQNANL